MVGPAPQASGRDGDDRPTTAGLSVRRRLVDLDPEAALALQSGAAFGRVVFTYRARPEIRLATRLATAVTDQLPYPTLVAYQADELDAATRTGWSVFATGVARPVTETERVARYELLFKPWVDQPMDSVFAIEPQFVVGLPARGRQRAIAA